MREQFAGWVGVIILVMTLTSCSTAYDVCVVNDTDVPLSLRYQIADGVQFMPNSVGSRLSTPQVLTVKELDSRSRAWQPIAASSLQFDEASRSVFVTVPARSVVRLTQVVNTLSDNDLPLTELELVGSRGEIRLVGSQVRLQFVNVDRDYRLSYR